jgi:hypothetical protein
MGDKLTALFLSPSNVNLVNNQIMLTIQIKTNNDIPRQDPFQLRNVMSRVLENFGRSAPGDDNKAVEYLNALTLGTVIPHIISEMKFRKKYTKDISTYPQPLPYPVNTSITGEATR